ncbi:MAG: hypothetical protein KDH96_03025 [Candidatus Riesia sp.]|nr:hypothetical protein [Candidatus Riesia sp.]
MMSLLSKLERIPGEMCRLPSHGIGYEQGVFADDVTNGDVMVFPVSSYDEIILKTPEKLLSGTAIYEVFKRRIPAIKQPEKLFHKDVDFLMTVLRKVSYGEEVQVTFNHECKEDSKDHSYVVNISSLLQGTKRIDPTALSNTFTLENGQEVCMGTMLFSDMLELTQLRLKMMNQEIGETDDIILEYENTACDAISRSIISVDDVTDKQQIKEWLFNVPIAYREALNVNIEEYNSSWGMSLDSISKCKDCGQEISLRPTINPVSFFMLP